MSKLCPSCNGLKRNQNGCGGKVPCTTCNGIGYVFDAPIVDVIEEIENKFIDKDSKEAEIITKQKPQEPAKKRGRPKKVV